MLPPTDPRLADLTDEQIELDIMLFLEDNPELKRKAEVFTDTEYERAMKEELGEIVEEEEAPPMDMQEVPFDK